MKIIKSIVAILAGFIVGALLSVTTDSLLTQAGFMIDNPFRENTAGVVVVVIVYRFVFNSLGSYVTARLAPSRPMLHVWIIGAVGTVLAIVGSVVMWDQALPWYNIAIILISLPSAWVGGRLAVGR